MRKPFDIELLLDGVLTGSLATRQRHRRQAKNIQAAIYNRWHRDNPWTWQQKHLQWYLKTQIIHLAEATKYYFLLTANLIVKRMKRSWKLKLSA